MPTPTFYKQFLVVSGLTALLLIVLGQFALFQPYSLFSFICLLLFMGITLLMFLVGKKSATSSNKGLFTSIVIVFTFGKIVLSFAVVLLYYYLGHPNSKAFILPFFIVYLIFTIFETHLMMQLGKQATITQT